MQKQKTQTEAEFFDAQFFFGFLHCNSCWIEADKVHHLACTKTPKEELICTDAMEKAANIGVRMPGWGKMNVLLDGCF